MRNEQARKKVLCPADKSRVRLADSDGFYREVVSNGSKRWFSKCRFESKEKRLVLGGYSKVSLRSPRIVAFDIKVVSSVDAKDAGQAMAMFLRAKPNVSSKGIGRMR